jgi:hypothetical protein
LLAAEPNAPQSNKIKVVLSGLKSKDPGVKANQEIKDVIEPASENNNQQ